MSKTLIDERQPVREMVARRLIIAAWGADARLERAPALDRERFRNHAEALLVELEDAGWLVTAVVAARLAAVEALADDFHERAQSFVNGTDVALACRAGWLAAARELRAAVAAGPADHHPIGDRHE